MRLAKECQKCDKFSHCNNNDLFCEKFITQELQKAKEENEYRDNMLCEQIEIWRSNCDAWMNQSNKFEQQNKQMREIIEKLYTVADDGQNMIKKHNDYNGKIYGLGYLQDIKDRIYNAKQALKEGE